MGRVYRNHLVRDRLPSKDVVRDTRPDQPVAGQVLVCIHEARGDDVSGPADHPGVRVLFEQVKTLVDCIDKAGPCEHPPSDQMVRWSSMVSDVSATIRSVISLPVGWDSRQRRR